MSSTPPPPLILVPPDERVPLLGPRRPSSPTSSVGSHNTQNSLQAFLDPETAAPARRVRVNALRTTLGETTWSSQSNSKSSLFVTTVLLPQVLAAAYVLPKYWRDEECVNSSSPIALREWILGDAVVKFFQILLTWTPFVLAWGRSSRATAFRVLRFQRTTSFVVDVFSVVWVVQGTNLFLAPNAEDTCHAPHLFPLGQFNFALSLFFFTLPVLICLMFVPLVCCCFPCFVRFLLAVRANDAPVVGATPNELDTLPTKQYDPMSFQGSNDDKTPQCAICLSQYAEGEQIRELPCDSRHHFHRACVDDWLRLNATCPVCRSRMFQRGPLPGTAIQGAPRTTNAPLRTNSYSEDEVESHTPPVFAPGREENVAPNTASSRNTDDSLV